MRKAFVACVVVVIATASPAWADLASGRDMLIAGKYKDAIAELGKVSGGDRTTARVLMAEAQAVMGDFAAAEKTLSSLPQGKDAAGAEVRLMLDEVRVATGRSAEARKDVGSSRVDLQACKLEYSIVSPK